MILPRLASRMGPTTCRDTVSVDISDYVDDEAPYVGGGLVKFGGSLARALADIVEQHIDKARLLRDPRERTLDCILVAAVECDREHRGSGAPHHIGGLIERHGIFVQKGQARAFRRHSQCGGAPDPRPRRP